MFCSHKYAHNDESAQDRLPSTLKGIDFAVYAAFQALGLHVKAVPIMKIRGSYGGVSTRNSHASRNIGISKSAHEKLRRCQKRGETNIRLHYEYEDLSDDDTTGRHVCRLRPRSNIASDFESRISQLQNSRQIKGLANRHTIENQVTVGTEFEKVMFLDEGGEDYGLDEVGLLGISW